MTADGDPADRPPVDLTRFPHSEFGESLRQSVLDAAAVLQVRRSELATRLVAGPVPVAEVIDVGASLDGWVVDRGSEWRELLSVQPAATAAQLRTSVPPYRRLAENGLRMVSLFDHDGLDEGGRLLLANEPVGSYKVAICPVQMKILNRRFVLLQGPEVGGRSTVMRVTSGPCVDAAWRYWEAALASAVPANTADVLGELTPRQRQIMALLTSDVGDEAIAAALDVSVRTVRSDVAAVLEGLGVKSRFAAGNRLRIWEETHG